MISFNPSKINNPIYKIKGSQAMLPKSQSYCFSSVILLLIRPLDIVVFVLLLELEICCWTNSILLKY